jgi:DNA-directed RNA polymerase specialized sigma24 family protein
MKKQEEDCRQAFEAVLPRIHKHAQVQFRQVRCPGRKEELIAETLALSWKWWLRLWDRGKDPRQFVSAIADYAVKAARCGRRLCGRDKAGDVLSPLAQRTHGFTLSSIPDGSTLSNTVFSEALIDNLQTPPDEQAAFRIDFPAWLVTYDARRRDIIEAMALGERTKDISDRFGLTQGRISQMRQEFFLSWELLVE